MADGEACETVLAVDFDDFAVRFDLDVRDGLDALSRLWDMEREMESARTSMLTERAYWEKCTAAWPAEFAPPIM